jgi:hypothetical protein
MIPAILKKEDDLIGKEILGQFISAQFDSTSRLGDAMNVVVRFCTADFVLTTRLTLFITLLAAANGNDTAAVLGRHFLSDLRIPQNLLVSLSRDSCAVNGVAVRQLAAFYPTTNDILCVSHILASVGSKVSA